jgi:hypothetical protein
MLGMEISEFLVVFLSQDPDPAKTSGLAECAKAVNKTKLGRRLLMLTCMKPRLLRLQKSSKESACGIAVELGTAGPGFTSTLPEEQRRRRIRIGRMALKGSEVQYLIQNIYYLNITMWKPLQISGFGYFSHNHF